MAALSNFWQRIITGSIFLVVMIGSIMLSFQSFLLLFGVITVLATYEYIKITSMFSSPNKWMLYIASISTYGIMAAVVLLEWNIFGAKSSAFVLVKSYILQHLQMYAFILFPVLFVCAELFRKKERPFENIAYTVLGYIYITVPFVLLIQVGDSGIMGYQYPIILVFFLSLWVNDSFAYVWGRLLGRHKLAPNISAGKTIEGTIGGILTTAVAGYFLPLLFTGLPLTRIQVMIFSLLVAIFAVPSDLGESLLKRQAGIKDSGKILPGHGGILDRFDSVLLTAPVIYIYLKILAV